jgi:hypothetical protein
MTRRADPVLLGFLAASLALNVYYLRGGRPVRVDAPVVAAGQKVPPVERHQS